MDEKRRRFLKITGCGAVGAAIGLPLLRETVSADENQMEKMPNALTATRWAMVVDIKKCSRPEVIGAAIEACHREHNVPSIEGIKEEIKWIWTDGFEHAFPNQYHEHLAESLKESQVPVLCNHCEKPPCVRVCPTQATYKTDEGIVAMDMHRCVGCRYCMTACPFGARSFNWKDPRPHLPEKLTDYPTRCKGVVEKCNFCAERLAQGLGPVCVEACNRTPGGRDALVFGDLGDEASEVSRILKNRRSIQRKPSLGTGPSVYYLM